VAILDLRATHDEDEALRETALGMERGVEAIAQATLEWGEWFGRPDVLRRVERPGKLGGWSYEVYDCKLARETKATTILQLSLYSELIEAIQGSGPEFMYVVPPGETFEPEQYRVLDYAAYYRYVKGRLAEAVRSGSTATSYPEPTEHCEMCKWWSECDGRRRRDDHLSLVAGISRLQRKQLSVWQTHTVVELARLPVPLAERPVYGSKEGYVRIREQARIQVAGRERRSPVYEVLAVGEEHGLSLLPEPSPGDIFFDLEGDPFVGLSGQEYLFGVVLAERDGPTYAAQWALTAAQEKQAFEWVVDLIMDRWARDPGMHIYHFAPYEPSALKRLMGRHATREDEIDRMLRAQLFVDLHTVVKRSVRASVEQYSLKALEQFHGFGRRLPLPAAATAMRRMQHALELGRVSEVDASVRDAIELYNADDCFSTLSLRDWLEGVRAAQEQAGQRFSRPVPGDGAPAESVSDRQQRAAELVARLQAGVPADPADRDEEQAARWLLSNLIDWHRREAKAEWWEYFRLKDLTDEELLDERNAVSGLRFVERIDVTRKIPTDRYSFEKQETSVRAGDDVCAGGDPIGCVVRIDIPRRTIDIKKTRKAAAVHPAAVFVDGRGPRDAVLADALYRLGTWVADHGIDGPGEYRAARDLLLRRAPRMSNGQPFGSTARESALDAALRIGSQLDHSVLAIQGPPGSGKTFTGARMICDLVRQGKKVGITATSHKVIRNLLDDVLKAAPEFGLNEFSCIQKVREDEEDHPPGIRLTKDNAEPLAALRSDIDVGAGTAWLWSREEYSAAVDVLFVDEAGQMSLANVLAISQAAKSVVLLGDPQQLDQPLKGSHPDGADVSALEHILVGAKTMPPEQGLFLEKTWRMHPRLCTFTSEVFYEGRLHSRDGLERQNVVGPPSLPHAGLWFVPVEHEGNQNASPEEVDRIAGLVRSLVGVTWVDDKGVTSPLTLDDILIVAPYNAQVSDLAARLPGARIGTVDKFQGQQAPVVIYSLTTSSPEDAPRGMEFLYSLNRLNVATSRAKAMAILVGSPGLLEPDCRSPRQMQLANALCRFVEMAERAGAEVRAAGEPA
jgi:predicted RecB family nuclease